MSNVDVSSAIARLEKILPSDVPPELDPPVLVPYRLVCDVVAALRETHIVQESCRALEVRVNGTTAMHEQLMQRLTTMEQRVTESVAALLGRPVPAADPLNENWVESPERGPLDPDKPA